MSGRDRALPGDGTTPGQPLKRVLFYSPGCISTPIRHERRSECRTRDGRRPGRHYHSVRADASLVVGIAHRVETPPADPEILDHFCTAPTARCTIVQSVMPHGMTVAAVPQYKTKHRLSPRRSNVRFVPRPCFFRNGERYNAAMQLEHGSDKSGTFEVAEVRRTRRSLVRDRCAIMGWSPTIGVMENRTKLRELNQYIVRRHNSR